MIIMNKEQILNTFLLANIPEIITQEEFDDVKKAIFEMLKENKKLKDNWDKLRDYLFNIRQRGFELQNLANIHNTEPNIAILIILDEMV